MAKTLPFCGQYNISTFPLQFVLGKDLRLCLSPWRKNPLSAVEKGEQTSVNTFYRITVGSVQTLQREKRLQQFRPDYFDTIIVDEAHHILSNGYQKVMQYFNQAQVLGVTATADRGDMRNLGEYFDSLAYEYSLPAAIKDGYLAPIKAITIPLKMDISSV
ncbi:hypothetical protein EQ500_04230, partial [Lactobacillus sp. XV13L]|nr:hypothetical protein [Lactobacillus sp. XV13L]